MTAIMTVIRLLRNAVLVFLGLAVILVATMMKKQSPIVLLPNQSYLSSATLVYIPGGKVPAEAYVPIIKAIQREFETHHVGLSCILIRYPRLLNFEIIPFWGAEGTVYHALTFLEMSPSKASLFIGGHSIGAILSQSVVYRPKRGIEYRFSGVLLHSAFIFGRYRSEPIPVPTLTLSGSRDGLNRFTALAKQYVDLGGQVYYRHHTPTVLVEGMNHMQLIDFESEFHRSRDLTATISTESAQALTAMYSARFLLRCMRRDVDLSDMFEAMKLSKEKYFDPFVIAMEADLSGETCVEAQKIVFEQEASELEIYSIPSTVSVLRFTFCKPRANETHVKVAKYAAPKWSLFHSSKVPQALQLLCKMNSKEQVFGSTSNMDRCFQINEEIIKGVFSTLSEEAQAAYLNAPSRLTFSHDVNHTSGPGWLTDKLHFVPKQDSVSVQIPRLKTAPGTGRYAGKLYCHFVSQSQAFEHFMIDAHRLRNQEGVKAYI